MAKQSNSSIYSGYCLWKFLHAYTYLDEIFELVNTASTLAGRNR